MGLAVAHLRRGSNIASSNAAGMKNEQALLVIPRTSACFPNISTKKEGKEREREGEIMK